MLDILNAKHNGNSSRHLLSMHHHLNYGSMLFNLPRQKLNTLQVYPVLMAKHVKINFTIIDSNQFLSGLSVPQPANLESSQVNENLGKI